MNDTFTKLAFTFMICVVLSCFFGLVTVGTKPLQTAAHYMAATFVILTMISAVLALWLPKKKES